MKMRVSSSGKGAKKPRARVVWLFAAMLALGAVGAAAVYAWQWVHMPARVQAGLPALPEGIEGRPEAFRTRLERARAAAMERATLVDGVTEMARLFHANGYSREAETCWRLLRTIRAGDARAAYYLADLARASSDYEAMSDHLRTVVRLAPDYAPAWLQIAGYEFKNGRMDEAAHAYRRRLELIPSDPYSNLGLSRIALQEGRRDEARALLERVIREVKGFSAAHNLYAELLAADGDAAGATMQRWLGREAVRFREADDPWLEELNSWCFDAKRLQLMATIQFLTERGDRGRALMRRAVEIDPSDPAGYAALGDWLLRRGEYAEARGALKRSIELSGSAPVPLQVFTNLSAACRKAGDPAAALEVARDAMVHYSEAFEPFDAAAMALAELRRLDEAEQAWREALRRNPNDVDTNFNLAVMLLSQDRTEEAVECLKRTLVTQPSYERALTFLGDLMMKAGKLEQAAEYIKPLYEFHRGRPDARRQMSVWCLRMGRTLEEQGDLAGAEKHYREGIVADPERVELSARLGLMLLMQGRVEQALPTLEAYRRLEPRSPQSALALGQAYASLGRIPDARRVLTEGEQQARASGNARIAEFCRKILASL